MIDDIKEQSQTKLCTISKIHSNGVGNGSDYEGYYFWGDKAELSYKIFLGIFSLN